MFLAANRCRKAAVPEKGKGSASARNPPNNRPQLLEVVETFADPAECRDRKRVAARGVSQFESPTETRAAAVFAIPSDPKGRDDARQI